MRQKFRGFAVVGLAVATASLLVACATAPPTGPMGFFVTSVGSGKGADLGGLAGADAHCQKLATAAGSGQRNWRAYLTTPKSQASRLQRPPLPCMPATALAQAHGSTPRVC